MNKIVNLTPHEITVVGENNQIIATIPASGMIARLAANTKRLGSVSGIPISKTEFSNGENIPEPVDGTLFIVSQMIKNAYPDRWDFVVPAETVRDEQGRIIGCRSLGI